MVLRQQEVEEPARKARMDVEETKEGFPEAASESQNCALGSLAGGGQRQLRPAGGQRRSV